MLKPDLSFTLAASRFKLLKAKLNQLRSRIILQLPWIGLGWRGGSHDFILTGSTKLNPETTWRQLFLMPEGGIGSQLEKTQLQTTHSKGNLNLSLPSHTIHHPGVIYRLLTGLLIVWVS